MMYFKSFYRSAAICSALFLLQIIFAGCSHSQVWTEPISGADITTDGMQPIAYGTASNCGYYLFNIWPLHTGHPGHPNRKDYRAFHDDVRPGRNLAMLQSELQRQYKVVKLINVEHQESSWGYFSLWLVWRKSISTTAVGLRQAPKSKK